MTRIKRIIADLNGRIQVTDAIIDVNKKIIRVSKNDTVVIGQAFNAKEGAIVVSDNENMYYTDDLCYWDEKVYRALL